MAATATVLIPMEEYLRTSYEYDREWIDGEVRERAMPDEYHAAIQAFFIGYFQRLPRELGLRVRGELRVRVASGRFRLPDVCLLPASAPLQPIPDTPPVLCIEVLSPDDAMGEVQEKIADYLAMGVRTIWLVEPRRRMLFLADADGTHPVTELVLPGTAVRLGIPEIFAELDEMTVGSGA